MLEEIYLASTAKDYEAFARLVTEYVRWCRTRYQDDAWFVDRVFGHQSLDSELKILPATYGPPNGKTLLASIDGQVCGAGAYHRLGDGTCEMKRLFVSEKFQGHGIGRRLCAALIASATEEGYELMRLDSANRLKEAIGMYRSFGFEICKPYRSYPEELMPYLVFMELRLVSVKTE
jgi:ribosomal protein S18 acetylase RimI-like enzyme